MAVPPSYHRHSVHLPVSKTCRVEEKAHTVGHSEATSSAKWCLPSPHPPFRLPLLPVRALFILPNMWVDSEVTTCLIHTSCVVYFKKRDCGDTALELKSKVSAEKVTKQSTEDKTQKVTCATESRKSQTNLYCGRGFKKWGMCAHTDIIIFPKWHRYEMHCRFWGWLLGEKEMFLLIR